MFHGIGIDKGKPKVFRHEDLKLVREELMFLVQDWDGKRIGIWDDENNIFHLSIESKNPEENIRYAKYALGLPEEHSFIIERTH